jgi:hypothetical protein
VQCLVLQEQQQQQPCNVCKQQERLLLDEESVLHSYVPQRVGPLWQEVCCSRDRRMEGTTNSYVQRLRQDKQSLGMQRQHARSTSGHKTVMKTVCNSAVRALYQLLCLQVCSYLRQYQTRRLHKLSNLDRSKTALTRSDVTPRTW